MAVLFSVYFIIGLAFVSQVFIYLNLLISIFNVFILISVLIINFIYLFIFEPVHEKTNNLGFRPDPTQPGCTVTDDG